MHQIRDDISILRHFTQCRKHATPEESLLASRVAAACLDWPLLFLQTNREYNTSYLVDSFVLFEQLNPSWSIFKHISRRWNVCSCRHVLGIPQLNDIISHFLIELVPPRDSPWINSPKTTYRIGEDFTANCSSFPSRPAATISWTIADKPVIIF